MKFGKGFFKGNLHAGGTFLSQGERRDMRMLHSAKPQIMTVQRTLQLELFLL